MYVTKTYPMVQYRKNLTDENVYRQDVMHFQSWRFIDYQLGNMIEVSVYKHT